MGHGVGLVGKYTSPHPPIVHICYGEAGRSDPVRPGPTREMQTQWAPGVVLTESPKNRKKPIGELALWEKLPFFRHTSFMSASPISWGAALAPGPGPWHEPRAPGPRMAPGPGPGPGASPGPGPGPQPKAREICANGFPHVS